MNRLVLAAALLSLAAFSASAAGVDVGAWLRSDAALPYRDEHAAIERVFADAQAAGLPPTIIMDKLREGARKKVAAGRLLDGLRAEVARLAASAAALARQDAVPADDRDREDVLRSMSLALLGGLPAELLEEALSVSTAAHRDPADFAAALGVLIQLRDTTRLGNDALAAAVKALLRSRLTMAAFRSVPAFFARAAARGMSDQDILDRILLPVLAQGGGIIQMDDSLRRWAERSGVR